jgi:hypothetical protein
MSEMSMALRQDDLVFLDAFPVFLGAPADDISGREGEKELKVGQLGESTILERSQIQIKRRPPKQTFSLGTVKNKEGAERSSR